MIRGFCRFSGNTKTPWSTFCFRAVFELGPGMKYAFSCLPYLNSVCCLRHLAVCHLVILLYMCEDTMKFPFRDCVRVDMSLNLQEEENPVVCTVIGTQNVRPSL